MKIKLHLKPLSLSFCPLNLPEAAFFPFSDDFDLSFAAAAAVDVGFTGGGAEGDFGDRDLERREGAQDAI